VEVYISLYSNSAGWRELQSHITASVGMNWIWDTHEDDYDIDKIVVSDTGANHRVMVF
jgi:hypothetical protein